VASAIDFAAAMQKMIRHFKPADDDAKMCILVDAVAGQVLQCQGRQCIVFAALGPPLLQVNLASAPKSFLHVQDAKASSS
jgi:hypothetical protein